MNKLVKFISMSAVCGMLMATFCACDSFDEDLSDTESSVVEGNVSVDMETLKKNIVGEWGRLDEPMHYFYSDMKCVIGGMQGNYDIIDDGTLVMTTMSGSVTNYEWAKSRSDAQSENYWYLDGDTLTVNGNLFTKIAEEETKDQVD